MRRTPFGNATGAFTAAVMGFAAVALAPTRTAADPILADIARSVFERDWTPPGAGPGAGSGGLGPLYNARSCAACHRDGGRGRLDVGPDGRLAGPGAVVRLLTPDGEPDPVYGRQIQTEAIPGLAPEAEVRIDWTAETVRLADGTAVELRQPVPRLQRLAAGSLAPGTVPVLRVAPDLVGPARLARWMKARSELSEITNSSASWPASGRKAASEGLRRETARAFAVDMGLASPAFPDPAGDCPRAACREAADPAGEMPPHLMGATLDLIAVHLDRVAAAPAQDPPPPPEFARMGCVACHVPRLAADAPPLWSDFRRHDMGAGLAEPLADEGVPGTVWRTAPLAGLGRALAEGRPLLHDGRARDAVEAILWHGGAAARSADAFREAPAAERAALLAYLASLH